MSSRIRALVTPEVLCWARERADITLEYAAKYARIPTPERLKKYENGEIKPTYNQAVRLATLYDIPFAVLYLPEPPKEWDKSEIILKELGIDRQFISRLSHPALQVLCDWIGEEVTLRSDPLGADKLKQERR